MSWFSFNFHDFSLSFLSILFEGVPYLFLGTLLSGLIDSFLPPETLDRILPKNPAAAVALAGVLGVFLPMCECGMVPVIRRMIRKGLPVAPAVTYLLAAPIVNPVVALSTHAAFRGQDAATVLAFRMVLGYGIACTVGAILLRIPLAKMLTPEMLATLPQNRRTRGSGKIGGLFASPDGEDILLQDLTLEETPVAKPSFASRLLGALRTACFDFVDVAFYLVAGAMLTSVFNTAVNHDLVVTPLAQNVWVATYGMEGLAGLLSLCSTTDAFIAANFLAFPLAAKLAFMLLGPMMDLKLLFLYGLVFRRQFTLTLAVTLFVGIGLLCIRLAPIFQ